MSLRKSYLEYILDKVSDEAEDFGFGFSDVQAKLVKDVSRRHRLELTMIAGRSRLDQQPELVDDNDVTDGRNRATFMNAAWRFTPSDKLTITQRVAFSTNYFSNANTGTLLGDGGGSDLTWRADAVAVRSPKITFEAGGQVQRLSRRENIFSDDQIAFSVFDGRSLHSAAYGQMVWSVSPQLTVTPGGRIDRWSLTGDTSGSPWLQASWKLSPSFSLRGGTGIYRQFAPIDAVTGPPGVANPDLLGERAYHLDIGLEQTFGSTRWQLTLYDREERDVLRRDFSEFQLTGDPRVPLIRPGSGPPRWHNALDGHARGVEVLVQRRSTTGLTGWFSYAYGINRYTDRRTGESFDGDFDQRHTVNAYAVFRVSNRVSVAGKWRAGSNIPARGYWEQQGSRT